MPTAFLTDEQRAHYGQYSSDPDPSLLAKFFYLDDHDHVLIRLSWLLRSRRP
ncbi:MAG TPA: hypothetical protein VLA19_30560 [Herpetosiphonaceae bacterium]|nr:hypothetical protein [Herpetosiphonaceae bacterium]